MNLTGLLECYVSNLAFLFLAQIRMTGFRLLVSSYSFRSQSPVQSWQRLREMTLFVYNETLKKTLL